jgi:membrane protein YqaA with SNARE-associated domain
MDPIQNFLKKPLEDKVEVISIAIFVFIILILLLKGDIFAEIVHRYGMLGLLVAAFFSSTVIVTFPIEGIFPFLIEYGTDPITLVVVAAFGSLIGTWMNYGIGVWGAHLIARKIGHAKLERAKKLMDKYGWVGLLILVGLPIPAFPVDPLTIVPGILRMNPLEFTIAVFVGKIIHYGILVAAIIGLVRFF